MIAILTFSINPIWTRLAGDLPKRASQNAIMERTTGMARKSRKMPLLTLHEKRLRNTDCKLRGALDRLVKGLPTHPDLQKRSYRLTVATLTREARVDRNAIYTNHRSMIEELQRARDRMVVPEKLVVREDKLAQQRDLIRVLQIKEHRLVTENAVLLKRILAADAEVERQKRYNARLIAERDRTMKPASLPRGSKSGNVSVGKFRQTHPVIAGPLGLQCPSINQVHNPSSLPSIACANTRSAHDCFQCSNPIKVA